MRSRIKATLTRLPRWLGVAALAAAASAAGAASFTLQGSLSRDDDVRSFSIQVASAGLVGITSLGYAGGTASNGATIAAGGFDSMLFLYNASGALVAQSDDGIDAPVDPTTGLSSDAAISLSLAAGRYTVALTEFDNFALGNLSAGFSEAGNGNFTPALSGSCAATAFCDSAGNSRTPNWALNFNGVASVSPIGSVAAVPEPASAALLFAGLGIVGLLARRPRSSRRSA